ncbi:MAG TPA: hypothetical protein VGQ52_09940 [Gemmatimonadaceae bacterium]|jgi:hypothetical protein|nr:hypothetical protein [Gemmatimonadaceae bacterium]
MTRYAAGKRVVELEWQFSPGTAEGLPGVTRALDGGYCASTGSTGTVYMAGPFQLKGRSTLAACKR